MRVKTPVVFSLLLLLTGCAGSAAGLLGVPTEGVTSADYKDDQQLRVSSFYPANRSGAVYQEAFDRVVEMVADQGIKRFALIRRKCETTRMTQPVNREIGSSCVLWAQMLEEGETAEPKGKNDEVSYYVISESGEATPEG